MSFLIQFCCYTIIEQTQKNGLSKSRPACFVVHTIQSTSPPIQSPYFCRKIKHRRYIDMIFLVGNRYGLYFALPLWITFGILILITFLIYPQHPQCIDTLIHMMWISMWTTHMSSVIWMWKQKCFFVLWLFFTISYKNVLLYILFLHRLLITKEKSVFYGIIHSICGCFGHLSTATSATKQ